MIRRTLQQYLLRDARCFADLRQRPRVPAQRSGDAAVICYLKFILNEVTAAGFVGIPRFCALNLPCADKFPQERQESLRRRRTPALPVLD